MNRPNTPQILTPTRLPSIHPAHWSLPRIDSITQPEHAKAQFSFWKHYRIAHTWARTPPEKLGYRHVHLVHNITKVLEKMCSGPASNRDLFELSMLQRGWDQLQKDLRDYFAAEQQRQPDLYPHHEQPRRRGPPLYIAEYAATDSLVLSALYKNPPHTIPKQVWSPHPDLPPIAMLKSEAEKFYQGVTLGPILTADRELPKYRCGVNGCQGAWWFETSLWRHKDEVPHMVIEEEEEWRGEGSVGAICGD